MFENEKIDMRVKYTREWTFEALYKLLQDNKLGDIKISKIIEKAGISRATFYRNFTSKEDIVKLKVDAFYHDFYNDVLVDFIKNDPEDEQYLIQAFFKRVDEEDKLIDTVIKCNLEYMMIEGIYAIITNFRELFYSRVRTSKRAEDYTMEIVASSAWTLLSRWHKTGKVESPSLLSKIYTSVFRNVYYAIFKDRSLVGD
jgi:AcrR family transcriptional regulator